MTEDKFIGSPDDFRFEADAVVIMSDGSRVEVSETELVALLDPSAYRLAWCHGCSALMPWSHHYDEREASWDFADLGPWLDNEGTNDEGETT